jgi:hypothetical protein
VIIIYLRFPDLPLKLFYTLFQRTYSLCASPSGRRYSSSSDAFDTRSDPGTNSIDFTKDKEVVTYYQVPMHSHAERTLS